MPANTVTITAEQYQIFIEVKTKFDAICRVMDDIGRLDARLFNAITGYEIEEVHK